MSFCGSILTTKLLGPKHFGDYKVIYFLLSLATTLATFGFFYSSARLITITKDEEAKSELLGGALVICLSLSLGLCLFFLFMLYPIEKIYGRDVKNCLLISLPFIVNFPAQACLENALQGYNKITLLSAYRLAPPTLFFFSLVLANSVTSLGLNGIVLLQFSITCLVVLLICVYLRPSFKNLSRNVDRIRSENKVYGFHVYCGAVFNVATVQLGALLLGYFTDSASVGYFALAVTLASPLVMIPNSVGTSYFHSFATRTKIPVRIFWFTVGVSLLSLIIFTFGVEILVNRFFTKEYSSVTVLARIIAFGAIFHGIGDFVNRFLGAHGKGKMLRNCTMVVGIVNVFGYVTLANFFGPTGAALTMVISDVLYFVLLMHSYKLIQKSILTEEVTAQPAFLEVEQ